MIVESGRSRAPFAETFSEEAACAPNSAQVAVSSRSDSVPPFSRGYMAPFTLRNDSFDNHLQPPMTAARTNNSNNARTDSGQAVGSLCIRDDGVPEGFVVRRDQFLLG
jgi:hypothetical protein